MIPKFRFFDTEENKMHVVDSLYTFKSFSGKDITIATEDIDLSEWRSYSDGVLMQSTGLLDKNGKEIFEGDVLEILVAIDTETLNGEVVFEDGIFGVKNVLYGWGFEFGLVPLIEIILAKKVIIVGNKFTHPHLLEEE